MRLDHILIIPRNGFGYVYDFHIGSDYIVTYDPDLQVVHYSLDDREYRKISCTCRQDQCEHVRFVIEFMEGRGIGMVRNMLRNDGLDFVLTYEMVEKMFTDFYTYLGTTRGAYLMKRFVSDRSQPVAATPEPKEPPSPFSMIDVD